MTLPQKLHSFWHLLTLLAQLSAQLRLWFSWLLGSDSISACMHSTVLRVCLLGFPGGTKGKEPNCQCRRHKSHLLDPWVWKIPWRRAWQPTSVFLPGESHGQEEPGGDSLWGHKELDMIEQITLILLMPSDLSAHRLSPWPPEQSVHFWPKSHHHGHPIGHFILSPPTFPKWRNQDPSLHLPIKDEESFYYITGNTDKNVNIYFTLR